MRRRSKVQSANGRFWWILLKKSKIERLRKSREGRLLGLSAAARLFKTNTRVRGCVCVNRCGPSRRRAWNASTVLKNLVRRPRRTFSTLSVRSGHSPKPQRPLCAIRDPPQQIAAYSMTSSALTNNVGGIVRPSIFAVR
jgi:hypothetical protein